MASIFKNGDSSSTPFRPLGENTSPYGAEWEAFNLKIFRLVLDAAAMVLLVFFVRESLWPDEGNRVADAISLVAILALRLLLSFRPDWRRRLGWAALVVLMIHALIKLAVVDGGLPDSYALHPLIVLFAILTGDAALALTALAFVLCLYAVPFFSSVPLRHHELAELVDLIILTLAAGACSYAAWLCHRMLSREIFDQWRESHRQADLNRKLTSALFHDIVNPLFVIRATADLAVHDKKADPADMVRIGRMCDHIEAIREAVYGLEKESTPLYASTVRVSEIAAHLNELFEPRLALRGQELAVEHGGEIVLRTDQSVLCNSVLGNFLSNALRHAPPDSRISLSARAEGARS